MSRWIRGVDALVEDAPISLVGAKAAGLARLARLDCPVPDFAVLTTRAWSDCDGGTSEIPVAMRSDLVDAWQRLGGGPIAVRSSAAFEDSVTASRAGQLDPCLGVEGVEELLAAVRTCWASARACAELHGSSPGPVAVVLQRLVAGEVSGVLFSRDPEDPDHALVSAGLGLGEGVVRGRVPCDVVRVSSEGLEVEVADKHEEVALVDGQVIARPVRGPRRHEPALSEDDARRLFLLGRRLEEDVGIPVDVEFTVAGGRLTLLQVRPIAVPMPSGRRLLWDNAHIVESCAGVTTPLTFSFTSRACAVVTPLFCRVMGVPDPVIRAHERAFRRMIGLVRGRIYTNLDAWYEVLSLLPGSSFDRGALRLAARHGWRLLTLEGDARRFQRTLSRVLAEVRGPGLGDLRPDELLEAYERAERELLRAWTPPLVNDFFCMIFYRRLQRSCQGLTGDADTQLHDRLLAGHGSRAASAPAAELLALAELARDAHGVHGWLVSDEPDDAVFEEVLAHDGFRAAFQRWLDAWGDRSPDELKLESATLRDTPELVLQTLRGWLRRDELPRLGQEERRIRREAEREWRRLVPLRRRLSQGWLLSQARRRVALREALRLERARVLGFVRDLFRAFGEHYAAAGALERPDDVFYLTVDEVLGYTRGTTPTTDLRGLVTLRRAEFEGHLRGEAPAERFHTWGAVHLANRFRGRPAARRELGGDALQGAPRAPHTWMGTPRPKS